MQASDGLLLLADVLVPEQSPFATRLVIDDRLRVPELGKLALGHVMERVVDDLALEVLELWYPVPNVVSVRVALLRLSDRVEDALDGV